MTDQVSQDDLDGALVILVSDGREDGIVQMRGGLGLGLSAGGHGAQRGEGHHHDPPLLAKLHQLLLSEVRVNLQHDNTLSHF